MTAATAAAARAGVPRAASARPAGCACGAAAARRAGPVRWGEAASAFWRPERGISARKEPPGQPRLEPSRAGAGAAPSAPEQPRPEQGKPEPLPLGEQQALSPFHLAIPVHDIAQARSFYGGVLGCPEGRSSARWVDFNFQGHQLVCHLVENYNAAGAANAVDGDPVPVPHFGLALPGPAFHALAARIAAAGVPFVIAPHVRFVGAPGEQWTCFLKDPSGNALEFKAMARPENLFARYTVAPG